jgi:hypothetical protein
MARLLLDPEQIKNQDIFCVSGLSTVSSIAYRQTIQEYSPRKLHRLMSLLAAGIVPHRRSTIYRRSWLLLNWRSLAGLATAKTGFEKLILPMYSVRSSVATVLSALDKFSFVRDPRATLHALQPRICCRSLLRASAAGTWSTWLSKSLRTPSSYRFAPATPRPSQVQLLLHPSSS